MKLKVEEIAVVGRSTLSSLFVNGVWECFVLEDMPQDKKIWGETRIPGGHYKVRRRTGGRHFVKYKGKWSHKFTLMLEDVTDFKWIMIHIGNTHLDTHGCLLLGTKPHVDASGNFAVGSSTNTYRSFYDKVAAIPETEDIEIHVVRK